MMVAAALSNGCLLRFCVLVGAAVASFLAPGGDGRQCANVDTTKNVFAERVLIAECPREPLVDQCDVVVFQQFDGGVTR